MKRSRATSRGTSKSKRPKADCNADLVQNMYQMDSTPLMDPEYCRAFQLQGLHFAQWPHQAPLDMSNFLPDRSVLEQASALSPIMRRFELEVMQLQ